MSTTAADNSVSITPPPSYGAVQGEQDHANIVSSDGPRQDAPKDDVTDNHVFNEFGGPVGCLAILIGIPLLMCYSWVCLVTNQGHFLIPGSFSGLGAWFVERLWEPFWATASPNWMAVKIYLGFTLFMTALGFIMPGPQMYGYPVPMYGGERLKYNCNALWSWWAAQIVAAAIYLLGWFDLAQIYINLGPIMTVSLIWSFFVTFLCYFVTVAMGKQHRMSGNFIYDLFMGACLYPRLGSIDVKLFVELRLPWPMLFFVSVGCAAQQYNTLGYVTPESAFMVLAHWLYSNACNKGEECVITSWDMFYEKFGGLLAIWNLAVVPFMYCYSSIYLVVRGPMNFSIFWVAFCYALLLVGYFFWDTGNSQRNRFRMYHSGTLINRNAFPKLPCSFRPDYKYIQTEHGNKLLVDGWFAYARKPHYTADLLMALSWGLICGFESFFPYYYLVFFLIALVHRVTRDDERCAVKYGDDWKKYHSMVPYKFFPGIY
ncbi:C-24(28) sterol reductase [Mycoemilia scoparia]|uniref:Delta(24(24(1)))-sterol reductase n=1 Tax=Mycoemilia scoparia TaxID=417184 RepID=A0A9W8DNC3_9FUNG|nr:C-24(28) sterol reductase [Mycoemilia scoparia]